MNKNNKRKSAVAAMALTLLVGAGSLAYFTDQKFGETKAKTAKVVLDGDFELKKENMVPGDVFQFDLLGQIVYKGNADARIRLNLDEVNGIADYEEGGAKEGFVLMKGKGEDAVVVDHTKPLVLKNNSAVSATGGSYIEELAEFSIKLMEDSPNKFQDTAVTGKWKVEALQADHTTDGWTEIEGGTIEILPVK